MSRIDDIDAAILTLAKERMGLVQGQSTDKAGIPEGLVFHRPHRTIIGETGPATWGLMILTAGYGWLGLELNREAAERLFRSLEKVLGHSRP